MGRSGHHLARRGLVAVGGRGGRCDRRRRRSGLSASGIGLLALAAIFVALDARHVVDRANACFTSRAFVCGSIALATRRSDPSRGAEQRLVAAAGPPAARPALRDFSSFFWMSAPTKEGRAVLDRIAGFKQYLSITERERLDRMQAPEDTPAAVRTLSCPTRSRSASRTAGPTASPACSPRPRPRRAQQGFAWYSARIEPVERYRRLRQFDRLVARQHGQLGVDALPARPAVRAAADRRAAAAAAAAAAAGNLPRPAARGRPSDRPGRRVSLSRSKPSFARRASSTAHLQVR